MSLNRDCTVLFGFSNFFLEDDLIRNNCLLLRRKSILKDMPIVVKDKVLDEDLVQKESSVLENDSEEGSSWCQPVYFNYKCYSASFLSRARLAGLPKKVGPGTCSSHVFTNPEFLFVILSSIFLLFFSKNDNYIGVFVSEMKVHLEDIKTNHKFHGIQVSYIQDL